MTLASALKKKNKTVYQQIADKHGVSVSYVGKIARSERAPIKKKGINIKQELESLVTAFDEIEATGASTSHKQSMIESVIQSL